jgi:hypothetical protein
MMWFGRTPTAELAWGARAISGNYHLDIPPDRQQWTRYAVETRPLRVQVGNAINNQVFPWIEQIRIAGDDENVYTETFEVEGYELRVEASAQSSYGYIYIVVNVVKKEATCDSPKQSSNTTRSSSGPSGKVAGSVRRKRTRPSTSRTGG